MFFIIVAAIATQFAYMPVEFRSEIYPKIQNYAMRIKNLEERILRLEENINTHDRPHEHKFGIWKIK